MNGDERYEQSNNGVNVHQTNFSISLFLACIWRNGNTRVLWQGSEKVTEPEIATT